MFLEDIIAVANDSAEEPAPTPLDTHETVGGGLLCIESPAARREAPHEAGAWILVADDDLVDLSEVA